MKKYEYMTFKNQDPKDVGWEKLTEEGWELVSVIWCGFFHYFFKREKN